MTDVAAGRYRILGGPGSPYSLKLRAALRYRRIAHNWIVPPGYLGEGGELKAADKGMIPVMQLPDGRYWADSTPMILELETMHPGERSLLPDDPGDRFLALLIEDFADEWLVQPMFDFRWDGEVDQAFCAQRQMAGWLGAMPKAQFDGIIERFRTRQTGVLARLGDREVNRPLLRATYGEVLAAVEAQLEVSRFLFGGRPSIGDIGLFGQLSQCAIDPSASAIMRRDAVRTFQWVQDLDDASGIEGDWGDPAGPDGPGVTRLLDLIGEVFLPYMVANAAAVTAGAPQVSMMLRGAPYAARTAPYRASCLGWLKLALAQALEAGAGGLEAKLRRHGCWEALQLAPGERERIPPLSPESTGRRSGLF
ncbi:MAG: glutathione S-transferase family protein [Alphaproteobacteria bacterium]